ncbi:MAG: hypothetical protein KC646_01410 [Candidatus Cloacimonetes bacterium]|nr:hypothetical protein [Candidatus Cloacimonadota bacterium]
MLLNKKLIQHLEDRPPSRYLSTSLEMNHLIITIKSDRGAPLSESSTGLILFGAIIALIVSITNDLNIDPVFVSFIFIVFILSLKRSLEPYHELLKVKQDHISHDLGKLVPTGPHRNRFPFYRRKVNSKLNEVSNLQLTDGNIICDFKHHSRNIARMLSEKDKIWIFECLNILVKTQNQS